MSDLFSIFVIIRHQRHQKVMKNMWHHLMYYNWNTYIVKPYEHAIIYKAMYHDGQRLTIKRTVVILT